MNKVWRLLTRPQRVREAGIVMILSAALVGGYALVNSILEARLRLTPDMIMIRADGRLDPCWLPFFLIYVILLLLVAAMHLAVGLRTLACTSWAIWSGFLLSTLELVLVVLVYSWMTFPESAVFIHFGADPNRFLYYFLTFFVSQNLLNYALFSILLLATYSSALLAFYANRNRMQWS